MEIEIVTTTGTWITRVSNQESAGRESGAAARSVRERIKAEEPIEVRADINEGRALSYLEQVAVFNPGHVVAVIERRTHRRR
jgi:hypothetical protein